MSESARPAVPTPPARPGPPATAEQRTAELVERTLRDVRDLPVLEGGSATPDALQERIDRLTEAHDTLRAQLSTLGR